MYSKDDSTNFEVPEHAKWTRGTPDNDLDSNTAYDICRLVAFSLRSSCMPRDSLACRIHTAIETSRLSIRLFISPQTDTYFIFNAIRDDKVQVDTCVISMASLVNAWVIQAVSDNDISVPGLNSKRLVNLSAEKMCPEILDLEGKSAR
jgi:hypothetical protein